MQQRMVKIGTRGSPLALAQAHEVADRLRAAHGDDLGTEIVTFNTRGDQMTDRALTLIGGKGLFTEELEQALLAGDIDCAVHSAKDMPTRLPSGLYLSTTLVREDPRDCFLCPSVATIDALPKGALIGTASLRRRAQLLRIRPDLKPILFRGNLGTRLKKLRNGEAAASFLALAGLKRLKMVDALDGVTMQALPVDDFLPAPAQGAIVIEQRTDDEAMSVLLAPLNDADSATAILAERAFLAALDGSCRTPIAAHATIQGGQVALRGMILSLDGKACFEGHDAGPVGDAAAIGARLGAKIRRDAGPAFFAALEAAMQADA